MKSFELGPHLPSGAAVQPTSHLSSNKNVALFLTNTPIVTKQTRFWYGWATLAVVSLINGAGFFINHGPALAILSLPVLLFLNEGFQQTHPDEDATRRCALEGFAKGAIFGPPVLAMAEAVGGVILALSCFGQVSFENIVNAATDRANHDSSTASFSTRLFREASSQDPVGATIFALLSSLLIAGLTEEAFKMGIGAWQVLRYRQHKRTLNPIIVMAGVGLGLAYAESVVAVSGARGTAAARLASERVLTAFPIHVFCAIWTAKRASRLDSWWGALLPAALTHGLFDFGVIICSNFLTRSASLGWSFTAAAATTLAGMKST